MESALYYANPPEAQQISVEEEPPIHLYAKKLLYKDLNKMNTEKVGEDGVAIRVAVMIASKGWI